MNKKLFQALIGGAALVLALSSCGGGGGGTGSGNDNGGGSGGTTQYDDSVSNSGPTDNTFQTLPLGSTLPSGDTCASQVVRSTFEPRPENYDANHTLPTSGQLQTMYKNASQSNWPQELLRVDGNFTGTTDEILQWASCKWGINTDVVRAQGIVESGWFQNSSGDITADQSLCPPGTWNGSTCGQSWGILQIKYIDYKSAQPMFKDSTTFNADYTYGYIRSCMEGKIDYMRDRVPKSNYPTYPNGTVDQMLWRCIGSQYSGGWYDTEAIGYIDSVETILQDRSWEKTDFYRKPRV